MIDDLMLINIAVYTTFFCTLITAAIRCSYDISVKAVETMREITSAENKLDNYIHAHFVNFVSSSASSNWRSRFSTIFIKLFTSINLNFMYKKD